MIQRTIAPRMMAAACALLMASLFVSSVAADAGYCDSGTDACVIVNTTQDNNKRDDVLTLREGLLVQNGGLSLGQLTTAERKQVHLVTNLGLSGAVDVNFDPATFCSGCAASIGLQPPGLSDPDSYTGSKTLALPPGLGDPDGAPPGLGHRGLIGMGFEGGKAVPVNVVVDGSRLGSEYVGLWVYGKGAIQGITFQNFKGNAIEIDGQFAKSVTIGSDGDGVNDDLEAVGFSGNGSDVVILPAK